MADEYDAAHQRGEAARLGDNPPSVPKQNAKPTAADLGLSRNLPRAPTLPNMDTSKPEAEMTEPQPESPLRAMLERTGEYRRAVDDALARPAAQVRQNGEAKKNSATLKPRRGSRLLGDDNGAA